MPEKLLGEFSQQGFLPHNICLLKDPAIMSLHVASDALIAAAYFTIPLALAVFVKRRGDLDFSGTFLLFAAFILACGATHVFDIWILWHPDYLAQGLVKALTAVVSLLTAITLWPVLKQALQLPSPNQLSRVNLKLMQEITFRHEAEQKLRDREQQLKSILDTAADGILSTDEEGDVKMANPAAAAMLGYSMEALMGRRLESLFTLGDPVCQGEPGKIEKTMLSAPRLELLAKHHDGSFFPVEITTSGHTLVLRDIRERKAQEEAIKNLNLTLEQKVEERTRELGVASAAKIQFLANMSHEIRTPMNAILGFAQLLDHDDLTPEQHEMVQRMRSAGNTLIRIIDDILDITKLDAEQLRIEHHPFFLKNTLNQLDDLTRNMAEAKDIRFTIQSPISMNELLIGDDLRLQQVLLNLTANAIKFTSRGTVNVTVTPLSEDGNTVRIRFEVKDTGIGISPDILPKLFNPFTQADESITRRFGGTGLGLAISRRLVELMGGTLDVKTSVGQGSVFGFELSFRRADPNDVMNPIEANELAPASSQSSLDQLRILIVDDSSMNRMMLERALTEAGALATSAEDGQQALQLLKAQPQAYDAVLMDIQMPVMDGLTATRLIHEDSQLKNLPVFALTAGVLDEEREAALAVGVNNFLTKPVDLDELAENLASLRRVSNNMISLGEAGAGPAKSKDDPEAFPIIAGIDAARAATNSGHDPAFFLQMLDLFISEFENVGQSVRAEVTQGDLEIAARRLHNLCGNAGNLGAMELMTAAKTLSLALRQQPLDLDNQIESLCAQVRALVEASKPWLTQNITAAPALNGPIDPDKLSALRNALTERKLIALTIYAELEPAFIGKHSQETVHKLNQSMRQLRFDEALAWLQQHESLIPYDSQST